MSQRTMRRWTLLLLFMTGTVRAQSPALSLPEGFRAELYADDDLAHDIHSMTLDHEGRVVVSGPGYIRILVDQDGDNRADGFTQFSDQPRSGAQGMFFLGSLLLCSGDDGLLLFRDEDGDSQADGPPQSFLKILAGGEHHAHSIQLGPDGWWYINAGNFAGVTGAYATLPTSPLKSPEAGILMRLKPDLAGGEIVADGFRNAYDFAFTAPGDIFTFDSDGERDISLPWYRPTRVFQVTPMSHAGWVSRSWKRPADFADMPPVIAEFGRGSPTGVVCYRHRQFPEVYRNAVFVLDWTVGRIFALPLTPDGSTWKTEPIEFATASGQFGFAPTDAVVGPDGSLFVSVGGRGTRGGVFRIFHEAGAATLGNAAEPPTAEDAAAVRQVVRADQPLSAWSRAQWVPAARRLGRQPFLDLAADSSASEAERLRGIEILVEQFGGLDRGTASAVARSTSPLVRARLAWAAGRQSPATPDAQLVELLLQDEEPIVRRSALEALTCVSDPQRLTPHLRSIGAALCHADRFVRLAAASIAGRLSESDARALADHLAGQPAGRIWLALGRQLRSHTVGVEAAELAADALADSTIALPLKHDAVRLLELALSDVGPVPGRAALFDSYLPQRPLTQHESRLNPVLTTLADLFPSGDPVLDRELVRVFAMNSPFNRVLFEKILATITAQSDPASDIHSLVALSRFQIERSYEETTRTAAALLGIDVKIRLRELRQDSNWDDRIGELYTALCEVDPALPQLLVMQPMFGEPGHVLFMDRVPQQSVSKAIEAFVSAAENDDAFRWSNDVVFLIGESSRAEHQQLLRGLLDNPAVRDAVLIELADVPLPTDRAAFVSGLSSSQLNAVEACANALRKLPRSNAPEEQFELLSAARRLINDDREFQLRELMVRLLQNNTGTAHGFEFGEAGHRLQPEAMQAWQQYLEKRYPDYRQTTDDDVSRAAYATLHETDWTVGRREAGAALFQKLSCARCHGGRKALGPDLTGVAKRFSRADLFAAIVEPDRDVSSRYQTTSVVTTEGKIYSGLVVYKSVDGMLLRDADQRTYRFEEHEIETFRRQRTSLMPSGLLKGVDAQGMADLYEYLRSL